MQVSEEGSGREQEQEQEQEVLTPADLDDEELEAYAEAYARSLAFAEFEDIPEEELFSWSDGEDLGPSARECSGSSRHNTDYEDGMDVS